MENDIKVGDIKFYDDYIPGLEAGNYTITINQAMEESLGISQDEQKQLFATQEFVVSAPQFSIDGSEIHSMVPPDNSSGQFADELPHIVLNTYVLPWERAMSSSGTPWLALLVFSEEELQSGTLENTDGCTKAIKSTVAQYLALKNSNDLFVPPTIEKEDDIQEDQVCYYIQVGVENFKKIAPYKEELPYLAHVRQVNTGDKAIMGTDGSGWFGVLVANRFPTFQDGTGTKNIVHLVSMEGMEVYLTPETTFDGKSSIALLSLASWSFMCQGDNNEDFYGLMSGMVAEEMDATGKMEPQGPEKLLLRLPINSQTEGISDAEKEVQTRIQSGYAPVPYHIRSGEDTFAWYRGPLSPVLNVRMEKEQPFFTADAALIYDGKNGLFDCSLAAAWQAGRNIALADQAFGKQLLDFLRKCNSATDTIFRNTSLTGTNNNGNMKKLAATDLASSTMANMLAANLADMIGKRPTVKADPGLISKSLNSVAPSTKAALKQFLENDGVNNVLGELLKEEIAAIAQWLARKMLLYDVPFNYLVPDQRMLPMESMRFFYIDQDWTDSLFDGLLSIGIQSSRDSSSYTIMRTTIKTATETAMKNLRSSITGDDEDPGSDSITHMSGFIMRSAVVSGWPGMSVRAYDGNGDLVKILRLELMASSVMLGIFWGVPVRLELSEPQEGFQFGLNQEGNINLRNIISNATGNALGAELGVHYDVRSNYLRNERTLDLSPDEASGLVQSLTVELKQQLNLPALNLKPSDFAMQMVKSPERIVFIPQQVDEK